MDYFYNKSLLISNAVFVAVCVVVVVRDRTLFRSEEKVVEAWVLRKV